MVHKEFRLWAMNESGTSTSLNVTAVTRYHASNRYRWEGLSPFVPLSRLFTFNEGSTEVKVQCYLHILDYAPQGWHQPAEWVTQLSRTF
jgi:hypothetical protein